MMKKNIVTTGLLTLLLASNSLHAAVSEAEAARLGQDLTPMGSERAANASGTIPAWDGGIAPDAGAIDERGFLADPFAGEPPLFIITAANVSEHADKLSPGQLAMFQRYPDTYRIPVYPSSRTHPISDDVAAATRRCATSVTLVPASNGIANYENCRKGFAFPIPSEGLHVIWNHIVRYRGDTVRRQVVQATPLTNGSYTLVRFEDEVAFPWAVSGLSESASNNLLLYFKQRVVAPSRLAGNVLLVHETIDQVVEPRSAWVYNAGQRRVRRAPQVAYDGPGTASDGTRTTDNFDMYSGAPDRYDWRLVGKQEMYISVNNNRLASPSVKYDDILQAGHINQDLTRYELRRVWHIEATLKSGMRHIYHRRVMFVDEDSWQVAVADHYDGRGALWRVGEGHQYVHYAQGLAGYVAETLYDTLSGRYVAIGMNNEESQAFQFGHPVSAAEFTAGALRSSGVR